MKRFSKLVFTLVLIAVLFSSAGNALAQTKSKFIPDCALQNNLPASSECRNITIFVTVLINVGKYVFSIVGALALLFFIYGGFTLILSRGNPESVKKGTGIIVAAVIGLIIVFGAYILVQFVGSTLGVKTNLT